MLKFVGMKFVSRSTLRDKAIPLQILEAIFLLNLLHFFMCFRNFDIFVFAYNRKENVDDSK